MLNPGAEAGKIEAGGGEATFARAMLDEAVGDADLQQGQRLGFGGEQLGDRCAGPAEIDVFLDGHRCAVARRGIDRLEQRIRAGRDNHAPECTLPVRAARAGVAAWTWPIDALTVSR